MKKSLVLVALLGCFSLSLPGQEKMAGKIITDYFAQIDAHKLDAVGELLTDDFRAMAPFAPSAFDKASWKQVGEGFNTAFPDGKHELTRWFAHENQLAVEGIWRGTNTGMNMGNPPTGNRVICHFTSLAELDGNGKIRRFDIKFDQKEFERQLLAGINLNAQAEATIRGIMAAADAGDGEKVISYFTADAKHYFGGQLNTNDELKKRVAGFKAAFPDIKRSLDEITVNNNIVTVRGWLIGTNTGSFMGAPATGNRLKVSVLGLYKLDKSGKVTEAYIELDGAAVQMQLKGSAATGQK